MVKHALETLGVRYQSHKDYFTALLARSTADVEPDKPSSFARPTDASTAPTLSAYRELCTPLVRPPFAFDIPPLDCFARAYMRQASRRADEDREDDEGSLMSDETDKEALEAELLDDEALDEEDGKKAAEYEAGLWARVRA